MGIYIQNMPNKKNKIKRAKSPYLYYCTDKLVRERIYTDQPDITFAQIGRLIGIQWKNIKTEEKLSYINKPEKSLSAYIFFCCHERKNVIIQYPNDKPCQNIKKLSKLWNNIEPQNKLKYIKMQQKDSIRYNEEK